VVNLGEGLVIDGLLKRFDQVTAVDHVSFRVEQGEFFSLLGPSGCGKTTILRALAGLIRPDAGQIRLGGVEVYDGVRGLMIPPDRRPLGMVFQDLALWPHMTVKEHLLFALGARGASRERANQDANRALDLVRLAHLADRFPAQLSGGQQQRVALARAIAPSPSVLLMDEPFSALDSSLRRSVREEIADLIRQLGITTILVTHEQEEALSLSDRVAVMANGRILQLSTPTEIYRQPANVEVARFIGSMNLLPCTVESTKDGWLTAQVQGGGNWQLPDQRSEPLKHRPALIGFRPEAVELKEIRSGGNMLTGQIHRCHFRGNLTEAVVALESGSLLTIQLMEAVPTGTVVNLEIPPSACTLFAADSV